MTGLLRLSKPRPRSYARTTGRRSARCTPCTPPVWPCRRRSIVGFDDIPLTRYTNPALTTVRMTASDVGATAFNALFRLIGEEAVEGDVYQIPTKLVVRESTGRPKRK